MGQFRVRTVGILLLLSAVGISGCNMGGGISGLVGGGFESIAGFFGGDSSGSGPDLASTDTGFVPTSLFIADGVTETVSDSGGSEPDGTVLETAAVIHNPEPASLALFGGGLLGTGFLRRRKISR